MINRVVNTVLALALLGECALGQDQGQTRTTNVSGVPTDNAPSTTSLRPRFESGDRSPVTIDQSSPYYWKTTPVGDSDQLLTLFCGACSLSKDTEEDVPLVSVLRDTLGDQSDENDRVTYLWLLTCAHPDMGQRRELVQADFHVFASNHWNFNSRFPNPGGNHGGFFRISAHSVWMLSGAGIPARVVTEPYDSLNFASTILSLTGQKPPMPERVVTLIEKDSGSVAHAEEGKFFQRKSGTE